MEVAFYIINFNQDKETMSKASSDSENSKQSMSHNSTDIMSLKSNSNNKVFVGGFPVHLGDEDLSSYMSDFGKVLASKVLKKNGVSRGFGFVTFETATSAEKAVSQIHNIEGKKFECKFVLSSNDVKDMSKNEKKRKLFLGGISKTINEAELKEYFGKYGPVERVTVNREHFTNVSRGSGFVIFETIEHAEKVILENADHVLKGKKFNCQKCFTREEMSDLKSTSRKSHATKGSTNPISLNSLDNLQEETESPRSLKTQECHRKKAKKGKGKKSKGRRASRVMSYASNHSGLSFEEGFSYGPPPQHQYVNIEAMSNHYYGREYGPYNDQCYRQPLSYGYSYPPVHGYPPQGVPARSYRYDHPPRPQYEIPYGNNQERLEGYSPQPQYENTFVSDPYAIYGPQRVPPRTQTPFEAPIPRTPTPFNAQGYLPNHTLFR